MAKHNGVMLKFTLLSRSLFSCVISTIIILFLTSNLYCQHINQNHSCIGDVKFSVLPPDLFSKQTKGTWVLLDGKDISDSTILAKFLLDEQALTLLEKGEKSTFKMPDARGVFIRGMNEGQTKEKGDPDQNRLVGRLQLDTFSRHDHGGWRTGNPAKDKRQAYANSDSRHHPLLEKFVEKEGGEETRPKNIALFVYIRIN